MLKLNAILLDGVLLRGEARCRITKTSAPVFGWRAESDRPVDRTAQYRVTVSDIDSLIWDSGVLNGGENCRYTGRPLPDFTELYVHVEITDAYGEKAERDDWFYSFTGQPDYPWIRAEGARVRRPVKFVKTVKLDKVPAHAMALYCGIGYATFYVNGIRVNSARLDPAFTDFSRRCSFVFDEGFEAVLKEGDNEFAFVVADGYRNFDSPFLIGDLGFPRPRFDGPNELSAKIMLCDGHGGARNILTGEDWQWTYTNIISSSVYDGETYDARPDGFELHPAVPAEKPCGKCEVMTLPPVLCQEVYRPVDIFTRQTSEGTEYIVDFGQNIAGVPRLRLPEDPEPGRTVTLRFAELLDDSFSLFTAPLRKAQATDVYICAGEGRDGDFWQPEYTYHGFRYCSVAGYGEILTAERIQAVALYTDLEETGYFRCGNPELNAIHTACVQTEKANIHSILTDCPQRDERMGWMNDATVRFEETPYNFEIDRIFPKVVDDICDAQDEQGRITCTAPFIIGARPADPVCSSFLVAGREYFKRTGDVAFVAAHYDSWRRWEEYLLSRSDGYIVNYSYYGDWAGPMESCFSQEDARSKATPGILMSTGYSYFNCLLLSDFAGLLGLTGDVGKWNDLSRLIRKAFLDKWYDPDTGRVAEGSQGSQAFALWLGLVPKNGRAKAFSLLLDDIRARGNKFTTGNLTTRYLFDVLTKFGEIDTAMDILLDEKYPGYGFMLENGATTIWERFELKKDPSMNSHNHPMYASIDRWFYAYILGIKAGHVTPGDACEFTIRPFYPKELLSAQGWFETGRGRIGVRWKRTYGKTQLSVTVPYGMRCWIEAGGAMESAGSGEHIYEF